MIMPSSVTVLRAVVSAPIMTGAGMLVMSMGLVPVDPKLADIANVFMEGVLPLPVFLRILGAAKIAGALSLWGYGPLPHDWAVLGMSIPALCGAYGHYVVEGPLQVLPPLIYTVLLATYFVLNRSSASTKKKDE